MRKFRTRCLLLALIFFAVSLAPARAQYTMVDLQALAKQHGWAELIAHLGDVPPSRRDDAWKAVAQAAGIGSIEDAIKTESPVDGLVTSENLLTAYPGVKDSPEFMVKRAEVGLRAFKLCFNIDKLVPACTRLMRTFVAEDPKNRDLAWRAGLLARLNLISWNAIPYFAMSLDQNDAHCSSDQVSIAVISGLALPNDDTDYHDVLAQAKTIAGVTCWPQLKKSLLENLSDASSYYRHNVCPILKQNGALTEPATIKQCSES